MDRFQCVNFIIDNIKKRKRTFSFEGAGIDQSIITEAFKLNLKLLCFVSSISYNITGGVFRRVFQVSVTYNNEEIDLNDIHVLSKNSNVGALMSQSCGNFKKGVYFVIKQTVGIEKEILAFTEKYGVYHPGCEGFQYFKMTLMGYDVYKVEFKYRIKKERLEQMRRAVEEKVDKVCKTLFCADMPEEVKAYLAHNYLIVNTAYHLKLDASPEELSCIHSAYGALINKKCVCQGYSEAFKMIMDKVGIGCDIAVGQIVGSTEHHAWNILNFKNGKSYHVDVTWDDGASSISYAYFCKPDKTFDGNRVWNKDCVKKCPYNENLLLPIRAYMRMNKPKLLKLGIPSTILDA